jgi:hypothetical protein
MGNSYQGMTGEALRGAQGAAAERHQIPLARKIAFLWLFSYHLKIYHQAFFDEPS